MDILQILWNTLPEAIGDGTDGGLNKSVEFAGPLSLRGGEPVSR